MEESSECEAKKCREMCAVSPWRLWGENRERKTGRQPVKVFGVA